MVRPKIAILRRFLLSDGKHFRYYSPLYDGKSRKQRPRPIVFNLEPVIQYNKRGEQYPILNIRTEKQLVTFIRDNFGYGEYWVYAMVKGREGLWTFWRGSIMPEGWVFHVKHYDRSDIHQIDQELNHAETDDERALLESQKAMLTDLSQNEAKAKRYGFLPFLLPSSRRGQFTMWDEPDYAFERVSKPKTERRNVDPSTMTLDEINSFE